MKYEELENYLQYDENESKVFMPNEIFEDLQNNMKNGTHIAFAYSFYYLISWLYRYTKYLYTVENIKDIKSILGYNPNAKTVDYIIKKNGILDIMGYTSTKRDFPIIWHFKDDIYDFEELSFTMFSEDKELLPTDFLNKVTNRFVIKEPIKAFYRTKEDYEEGHENGTFFEVENTHLIPFEVFMYCMTNENLGCTGFYLYSYIKMQNQRYKGAYDCPMLTLAENTGLANRTMKDYLSQLRQYKLVEGIHNQEFFCTALDKGKRKANSYIANDWIKFSGKPIPYEKIKVMEAKEYFQMLEDKRKEEEGETESFPLDILPF